MDFLKVKIYTTAAGTELLPAELAELGITGFEIDDAESFGEFLADKTVPWDYVDEKLLAKRTEQSAVTVYLAENAQGKEQLESIRKFCAARSGELYGSLSIETGEVREEDWANNWKQYFKPLKIGDRIIIKPSWETVSEEDARGRRIVRLDPGSSFGTGQHETTKLCLELLQNEVKDGINVLDMGCGSGILTIAALLLGASRATAVDVDMNACDVAKKNLSENGFSEDNVAVLCGNVLTDAAFAEEVASRGPYALILANIVADVLCGMAELFSRILAEGGTLIASGILGERVTKVRGAFEKVGLAVRSENVENEWSAITVQRVANAL